MIFENCTAPLSTFDNSPDCFSSTAVNISNTEISRARILPRMPTQYRSLFLRLYGTMSRLHNITRIIHFTRARLTTCWADCADRPFARIAPTVETSCEMVGSADVPDWGSSRNRSDGVGFDRTSQLSLTNQSNGHRRRRSGPDNRFGE